MFQSIGLETADVVDRKLKALELLVKIRLGGERVKPKEEDAQSASRETLRKTLAEMNGKR